MFTHHLIALLESSLLLATFARAAISHGQSSCRCLPGDGCWPSTQTWSDFNNTLHGKLIATTPLAAPCHDSQHVPSNASTCAQLQNVWLLPQTHYNSSSSVMAPYFANGSCDPFAGESSRCIIGTYVSYAMSIESAEDVVKSLAFAERHNIQVVIRNTGHDYIGKSTGAGALAIWAHHLKKIDIFQYASPSYTGKAMRMSAGVQGFEAYEAAHAQGFVVLGGECPTAGLAGGYTQGGGHSALGSTYGLAADQVLEWEVVDGRGHHLRATPTNKHADLYWALSGGGGGTYGVVLSMTVKVYLDLPTSGGNLTFTSDGISQDAFWDAIATYHRSLPVIVDGGIMSVLAFRNESFAIAPMTGLGVSASRMEELLGPLIPKLQSSGIKYNKVVREFPNYFTEFITMFAPIDVGTAQYGGRLVPRSVVEQNDSAVTNAFHAIADQGGAFFIVAINASNKQNVSNSGNPAWRTTLLDTVITTAWNFTAPWSAMQANADKMTDVFIPLLEKVSPGSGTYINEADFQDPDWQLNYYGVNYDRLLAIKNSYDPAHVFLSEEINYLNPL